MTKLFKTKFPGGVILPRDVEAIVRYNEGLGREQDAPENKEHTGRRVQGRKPEER